MLYTAQTNKSPEQVGTDLEAAVKRHRFGVLAIHDLQASMIKHGLTFPKPCRIYEVCQPQQAKQVLETNMTIATVLPCRVVVYQDGGKTTLAMIRPTALLGLFKEPTLGPTACEVESQLIDIMDEAVRATA